MAGAVALGVAGSGFIGWLAEVLLPRGDVAGVATGFCVASFAVSLCAAEVGALTRGRKGTG